MKVHMKKILLLVVLLLPNPLWADEALFAGGCFWCVEAAYQDLDGVSDVVSGFTGGELERPTYQGDHRGHFEVVQVSYDPAVISYQDLLDLYWINIDPFDDSGQFCDKGPSYRAAIFYLDGHQQQRALASRSQVVKKFPQRQVVTQVLPATKFWPVEEYHQDYYQKNPLRYRYYKYGCGREARLQAIWGEQATH